MEDNKLEEIGAEFEEYFGKTRGISIAALGVDGAGAVEVAAKTAFFAGYIKGMLKAEKLLVSPQ